jgi:hypothetical protein
MPTPRPGVGSFAIQHHERIVQPTWRVLTSLGGAIGDDAFRLSIPISRHEVYLARSAPMPVLLT